MPHTFRPDPGAPGFCDDPCGLPLANRQHDSPSITAALQPHPTPPAPAVEHAVKALESNAVQQSLDAPPASMEAATRARYVARGARRLALAAICQARGGLTDAELIAALPSYGANTLRPRRVELAAAGLVVERRGDRGAEVKRDGYQVWIATDAGRAALEVTADAA